MPGFPGPNIAGLVISFEVEGPVGDFSAQRGPVPQLSVRVGGMFPPCSAPGAVIHAGTQGYNYSYNATSVEDPAHLHGLSA